MDSVIMIRLDEQMKREWSLAAARDHRKLSAWVRVVVNRALLEGVADVPISATVEPHVLVKTGRPARNICQRHKRLNCEDSRCF